MNPKKSYQTKQRDEVLRCIHSFGDGHFTAAEVAERLRAEGKNVGLATVYRTLDRMAEGDELRKYVVDGTTAACYQRAIPEETAHCREHFHLKCECCGRLIHVACGELSRIAAHIKDDHGFVIDHAKTVFYGRCENCQ